MKMHVAKSVADFSGLDYLAVEPSISTYNRIETLPTGPDLDAGLQASMADPLWLLARQWQFNEFQGEDAGTPIDSRFAVQGLPVSACFPGGDIDTAPQLPLAAATLPIEALIEQEPALARHPRFNAEAGLHLQRMIAHEGPASLDSALLAAFKLTLPAPADPDSDAPGLLWHVVWGARAIDAAALAAALRPLRDAGGNITSLPPALTLPAADHAAALTRLGTWLRWLDDLVLEADWPNPSWQRDRMEYRFSLGAFGSDTPLRLHAGEYVDGRLDWSSFDAMAMQRTSETQPPALTQYAVAKRHPTPVRYPGMPADRYWEFEDTRVNFAAVEAGPTDLTRMMIAEFALAFGNDWFLVPLELEVGALYRVEDFKVVDSFGIEAAVHPSRNSDGTPWRMYEMTSGAGTPVSTTDLLFLPPVADRALEGQPLEKLLLVRDEMANLAWGIEKVVQGASGEPVERDLEAARLAMRQQLTLEAGDPQLIYRLATHVPAHWIPLLPVRKVRPGAAVTEIWLQRAGLKRFYVLPDSPEVGEGDDASLRAYKQFLALLDANDAFIDMTVVQLPATDERMGIYLFHPRGRLLLADEEQPVSDTDSLILCEEEVPRAGAVVRRAFQYTRGSDGRSYLWVGRAKQTGRGEASSGLKFDSAMSPRGLR